MAYHFPTIPPLDHPTSGFGSQAPAKALSNDQNWLMADLGDARAFLRAERARGKFTPVFDAGLDD